MLKKKAIRKIIITTFSITTIFIICIIPSKFNEKDNLLNISVETTYVNNTNTVDVYLLGTNNYLTRTSVLLNGNDIKNNIFQIINFLTVNGSSKIPNGLLSIIPKKAKLNEVKIEDKIAVLDFNEFLFDIDSVLEERLIESITYSVINLDGIEGIIIKINGKEVNELPKSKKSIPKILNKNYGINKVYEIDSIHNVNKVILYYISSIDNKNYYVPVTKYLNDDREKIKIIIENLSSNYVYEASLMSILNPNTELINYEMEDNIMKLNFNQGIFTSNKLLEEVIYSISESVFENYDVNKILFQIDGKNIEEIEK